MGSGCGSPIADKSPSSARQLPIMAALHAREPTLYITQYTPTGDKSKYPFALFWKKFAPCGKQSAKSRTYPGRASFMNMGVSFSLPKSSMNRAHLTKKA